jgi:hypothetical protein
LRSVLRWRAATNKHLRPTVVVTTINENAV